MCVVLRQCIKIFSTASWFNDFNALDFTPPTNSGSTMAEAVRLKKNKTRNIHRSKKRDLVFLLICFSGKLSPVIERAKMSLGSENTPQD